MRSVHFELLLKFIFTQIFFLASLLESNSLVTRIDDLAIATKTCGFKRCLCSYNKQTDRYYLYCNDPEIVQLPDFSIKNRSNLIFAKLDFTNSGIRKISKADFRSLTLDIQSSTKSSDTQIPQTEHFETMLDHLKKTMIPIYHLDFDGIEMIQNGVFQDLILNSIKINSEAIQKPNDFLLLKIRFQNSLFDYSNVPMAQPFMGLLAKKLYFTNIRNAFISDSIFFGSIISEIIIENSPEFMGFFSPDRDSLRNVLLHKFAIFNSFNARHLSSDMIPGFVNKQSFNEILIKKCQSLEELKGFTFIKYPRLKALILSHNAFTQINRYSFSGLRELHTLDLSFNPLNSIEGFTFNDCANLRVLILESTNLKIISTNSFKGLVSLNKLKLSKSRLLNKIEDNAFVDMKKTLTELHFKDTAINLVEQIYENGSDPPYSKQLSRPEQQKNKDFWLDGLNLTLLTIDYLELPESWDHSVILCKFLRYIPETFLVNLQHDQECNSLVYLIYRSKNFSKNWEYRTPACYRSQIKTENDIKSYEKIKTKEREISIDTLETSCFLTITTTTATIRLTSEKPVESIVEKQKDQIKLPTLNFFKLMQVTSVICFISVLAIFFVCVVYRLKRGIKDKRLKRKNAIKNSGSTNSTFFTTLGDSSPNRRKIILPPNVIPKFDSKVGGKRSSGISSQNKLSKQNSKHSISSPMSGTKQPSKASINRSNKNQVRSMSTFGRNYNNSFSNSEQSSINGNRDLITSI